MRNTLVKPSLEHLQYLCMTLHHLHALSLCGVQHCVTLHIMHWKLPLAERSDSRKHSKRREGANKRRKREGKGLEEVRGMHSFVRPRAAPSVYFLSRTCRRPFGKHRTLKLILTFEKGRRHADSHCSSLCWVACSLSFFRRISLSSLLVWCFHISPSSAPLFSGVFWTLGKVAVFARCLRRELKVPLAPWLPEEPPNVAELLLLM